MSSWSLVALGDIFEIARGGSPRPIDNFITDDPEGINWITISDASEESKYITKTKRRIRPEGAQRSRLVKPGDFLLTNSMSFGRPYIMRTSGCIHDGWLMLSPRQDDVDANFFYHLLGSQETYAEFNRLAAGATVKNLNIDLVKGVKIPLFPLPEQRRIAKILDEADALRAKRRAALAQLDALGQSIFLNMFGEPNTNRNRWPTEPIGDVAEMLTGYPFPSNGYITGGKSIRLCRGANVLPGRINWDDLASWPKSEIAQLAEFSLEEGDVVIAMDRPWISEGFKIAQVQHEDCPSLLVQRVARLRGKCGMPNEFLFHLLNSTAFAHHCRPTETTVPHISPKDIRSFTFPVPPLELQRQFAQRTKAMEKLKMAQRASLAELEALRLSIQHRAFRGEL